MSRAGSPRGGRPGASRRRPPPSRRDRGVHPASELNTITGTGWSSYYFEDHAGYPQAFQAQLISLVFEGVFERLPELKIVLQEGGFAWLPWLMWRMDSAWSRLREEVPHLARPPSEVVREHLWFTTQPMEEPERPQYFAQVWDDLDMEGHALFATDYPHWDFDAPDQALPSALDAATRRRVLAGNARALYDKLPRPAVATRV